MWLTARRMMRRRMSISTTIAFLRPMTILFATLEALSQTLLLLFRRLLAITINHAGYHDGMIELELELELGRLDGMSRSLETRQHEQTYTIASNYR
jgi:uncharacterized membrane protein YraQ (UPF0718 family)